MIAFPPSPIPCVVQDENKNYVEAFVIYVTDSGMFENDIFTCCVCEGGAIKHYSSSQVKIHHNATFGIEKKIV